MTSIADKAAHVRAATDHASGSHHCHWPGCETPVKPAVWGCRKHWFMLPAAIRRAIWAAYRPGQEVTKTPSRSYLDAARDAQQWIAENYPQDIVKAYCDTYPEVAKLWRNDKG